MGILRRRRDQRDLHRAGHELSGVRHAPRAEGPEGNEHFRAPTIAERAGAYFSEFGTTPSWEPASVALLRTRQRVRGQWAKNDYLEYAGEFGKAVLLALAKNLVTRILEDHMVEGELGPDE